MSLPDDLLQFLRDVHQLIETRDERATTESDDLLRFDRAYGGLIEEAGNDYGLRRRDCGIGCGKGEFTRAVVLPNS